MFGVLDEWVIDYFWMFLEEGSDVGGISAFDVIVEEVLFGVKGLAIAHSYFK